MNGKVLIVGLLIATIMTALGTADYFIVEKPRLVADNPSLDGSSSTKSENSSSSRDGVKKGVQRADGVNIDQTLTQNGFTWTETVEEALMARSTDTTLQKRILLKDGDRVAFMAWVQTPNVKTIYALLKKALSESFSGEVSDLIDEPVVPPDGPPRDILSFMDPTLGEERFVFVRVKMRLFEFHVVGGKDEQIADLIENLAE